MYESSPGDRDRMLPNLRNAACHGQPYFTSEELSTPQAAALVAVCLTDCPVLEACTKYRDKFRAQVPVEWVQFTGVWAGQAYSNGRLRTRVERFMGGSNGYGR